METRKLHRVPEPRQLRGPLPSFQISVRVVEDASLFCQIRSSSVCSLTEGCSGPPSTCRSPFQGLAATAQVVTGKVEGNESSLDRLYSKDFKKIVKHSETTSEGSDIRCDTDRISYGICKTYNRIDYTRIL